MASSITNLTLPPGDADRCAAHPSACFIIPTLKRPSYLSSCLASIQAQTIHPASILVGIRRDDEQSIAVVNEFADRIPVRAIEAKGTGVIGSMSSCLIEAPEDLVATLDDDVELPPHWLETMMGHLQQHTDVLAAAGRDLLLDHPDMRRLEPRSDDVGTVHWYGRITGNHHRGGGKPRRVDVLRGSNCLFRGSFLREVGFEQGLRGQGAQVSWELALAFQAMHRRKRFLYDPNVGVLHHVAPRLDRDSLHRGHFDPVGTSDSAFNETFVTARHATGFRKWTSLIYQVVVGSPLAPGVLHSLRQLLHADRHAASRLRATIRGRAAAIGCSIRASDADAIE